VRATIIGKFLPNWQLFASGIIIVALALVIPSPNWAGEDTFEVRELSGVEVTRLKVAEKAVVSAISNLATAQAVLTEAEVARKNLKNDILKARLLMDYDGCSHVKYSANYDTLSTATYSSTVFRGKYLLTTGGRKECYTSWITYTDPANDTIGLTTMYDPSDIASTPPNAVLSLDGSGNVVYSAPESETK